VTRSPAPTTVSVVVALALAWIAWAASAADAPTLREGRLGDADFIIGLPAKWNGGLVMFAHGYQGEGPGRGDVQTSPLGGQLTSRGYAWAASGYRSRGYQPDWFLADVLALREHVIKELGPPRWTIIHGQSMGGHVAIASLELHPEVYQGGLIECGVVDGVGLVDWLRAYTAAAEYFSGVPLFDTPRPAFDALVNGTWLPLMGQPGEYTERGRRFDSVVKHLSGGDVPLRLDGMMPRYIMNLNPRDPGPARAQEFSRHADTRGIVYDIDPGLGLDAATLNREIRRIAPAPGARSRDANPVFAELTGKIRVPLMTLHETADFRVPFRLEQSYRRRAQAAGTGHLLVQRAVRWAGHCSFDGVAREQAFGDLVAWMERGVVPAGDDVLGDVAKLGLRWTTAFHPNDPARRP
jgi:prolyl oligopeptidase family protein